MYMQRVCYFVSFPVQIFVPDTLFMGDSKNKEKKGQKQGEKGQRQKEKKL